MNCRLKARLQGWKVKFCLVYILLREEKSSSVSKQKFRSNPGFVLYIGGQYFMALDTANYKIGYCDHSSHSVLDSYSVHLFFGIVVPSCFMFKNFLICIIIFNSSEETVCLLAVLFLISLPVHISWY